MTPLLVAHLETTWRTVILITASLIASAAAGYAAAWYFARHP